MATITWVAGALAASWTACFGTEANSLVSGDAVLSSTLIDNTTNGDTHMDVSVAVSSFTSGANAFLALYWYTQNQDGTTYGDGRFGTATAATPPANYLMGTMGLVSSATQAQEGSFSPTVLIAPKLVLPAFKGKMVIYNGAGGTLGSTVTIKYQTYKLQVA